MLSAHQIYSDSKENASTSSVKDIKLNLSDKPKGQGLKVSTNINHEKKSRSESTDKSKIIFTSPLKSFKETNKPKTLIQDLSTPEVEEEWPEVENMFIYDEPEDSYEDILPMSERFNKRDIDVFFRTSYIGRLVELEEEKEIPFATLEKIDLTEIFRLPSPVSDSDLYDDTPLEFVPEILF